MKPYVIFLTGVSLFYNVVSFCCTAKQIRYLYTYTPSLLSLSLTPSSVQSLNCVWLCNSMDCSMPGFLVHHQLPELAQTCVHPVGDAIQPSHPLSSIFPSIRVFSNESVLLIRWPKYWSFSFSISPSNDYSRLIFFRIDWFDLLAVQGRLKGLLQHHGSKASILWRLAIFIFFDTLTPSLILFM